MDNSTIANVFDELAELLEFKGENPFRIRAYTQGARAIRELDESVADIVADPDRKLSDLPGIGKTLAEKTETLLNTGKLPKLEQLREEVPDILMQMARIPGLGAKKAARLHKELDIDSLADLRTACESGDVAGLKGFGKKTAQSILDGLSIAEQAAERLRWAEGDALATSIGRHMEKCDDIRQMQWAGSYRRGKETIGDLDLLVVASDRTSAMDQLESYPERSQTIGRGETKISIRVGKAFQVDMRCVEPDQFGAALQYFTGSQAHNVHTRRIAKEQGLKINEYGVFRLDDETQVAGDTEEAVYAAIGLPWIPPELREDRNEFKLAEQNDLPELITEDDLRGDLHMHTTATDGQNTIREMADAAIARGLKYIAITDHSKRVTMAMGLDATRLREQWSMIDEIRPEYEGRLQILKGIECDILESGGMDLPDDVLAEADWVLASVHYGQRQPRKDHRTNLGCDRKRARRLHCAPDGPIDQPTARLRRRHGRRPQSGSGKRNVDGIERQPGKTGSERCPSRGSQKTRYPDRDQHRRSPHRRTRCDEVRNQTGAPRRIDQGGRRQRKNVPTVPSIALEHSSILS